MLEKRFARTLLGNLARVSQDRLEVSILFHQLDGSLVTYSPHAGNIVRGVANQGHVVGDKFGSDSKSLIRIFNSHPMLLDIRGSAAAGVQQPDSRLYQLLKILVTR